MCCHACGLDALMLPNALPAVLNSRIHMLSHQFPTVDRAESPLLDAVRIADALLGSAHILSVAAAEPATTSLGSPPQTHRQEPRTFVAPAPLREE
ncbi:hypothetical protein SAMN05428954_6959 [Streptomyces sp. 2112.3]|nr:hypothetical protein SAMN05428954_6959 [Streptomyces sp. 2112.3]